MSVNFFDIFSRTREICILLRSGQSIFQRCFLTVLKQDFMRFRLESRSQNDSASYQTEMIDTIVFYLRKDWLYCRPLITFYTNMALKR